MASISAPRGNCCLWMRHPHTHAKMKGGGACILLAMTTSAVVLGILLALSQGGYRIDGIHALANVVPAPFVYVGLTIALSVLLVEIGIMVARMRRHLNQPPQVPNAVQPSQNMEALNPGDASALVFEARVGVGPQKSGQNLEKALNDACAGAIGVNHLPQLLASPLDAFTFEDKVCGKGYFFVLYKQWDGSIHPLHFESDEARFETMQHNKFTDRTEYVLSFDHTILDFAIQHLANEIHVDKILEKKECWVEENQDLCDQKVDILFAINEQGDFEIKVFEHAEVNRIPHGYKDRKSIFLKSETYPPNLGVYLAEQSGWPGDLISKHANGVLASEFMSFEEASTHDPKYPKVNVLIIRQDYSKYQVGFFKTAADLKAHLEPKRVLIGNSLDREYLEEEWLKEDLKTLTKQPIKPFYRIVKHEGESFAHLITMNAMDKMKHQYIKLSEIDTVVKTLPGQDIDLLLEKDACEERQEERTSSYINLPHKKAKQDLLQNSFIRASTIYQ